MIDLFDLWATARLPATLVPVALVCAVLGAVILTLFTKRMGLGILLISTAVLFIGAVLANLLTSGIHIPLDRYYVRPMVISCMGMAVSSVLMLLLLARSHNE
ncbi:MAG: hypothetical protein NTZ54_02980 [Alphaproteobacteria bacterium]|uniref:hypothetical protein n=1 Tax=Aestuariivirga sp. TaxID=2650926 RepID=UPI0030177F95|nr:hypothetical protein [Alphaproteobacteria bacterium]